MKMAYSNFIPTVYNEGILRELEKKFVFVEDCNRKYEGDVKQKGDSVRIQGIGAPTIRSISKSEKGNDIAAAETLEDTSIVMYINQIRYYNIAVDDIDKAQANEALMKEIQSKTADSLADEMDKYVASKVIDSNVEKIYATPVIVTSDKTTSVKTNILDVLDAAYQKLLENNVSNSTYVSATVSPKFFTMLKKAYVLTDTDNSEMLKNGYVGKYSNIHIKMSNNVCKTNESGEVAEEGNNVDNIMIRTRDAVSFACPLLHNEPYRPENKLGTDAIKGFALFDSKVVKPKEIFNINVKYE